MKAGKSAIQPWRLSCPYNEDTRMDLSSFVIRQVNVIVLSNFMNHRNKHYFELRYLHWFIDTESPGSHSDSHQAVIRQSSKALTKQEGPSICLNCTKNGVFFSAESCKKRYHFCAAIWPFLFCQSFSGHQAVIKQSSGSDKPIRCVIHCASFMQLYHCDTQTSKKKWEYCRKIQPSSNKYPTRALNPTFGLKLLLITNHKF